MAVVSLRARTGYALPLAALKSFALRHAWVLPILGVAAWLRFSGISGRFLYGDEAEYAIVARYLSRDWTYLAYPAIEGMGALPFVSQPPLQLYIAALFMRVMGPTDLAVLLPPLLFGIATVAVVYAVGNRLGGKFVGLSAAALLAVLPFHVEMSRKGMLDAGYVFFILLTVYFLVAWHQDHRLRQAIGIGSAVAAAALTKLPGVLMGIVVLIVFLVAIGVAIYRRQNLAPTLTHGAIGAVPVVIGAGLYLGLLAYLGALQNLWLKLMWQFGRVDSAYAAIVEATAVTREWSWYLTDPRFGFQKLLSPMVFTIGLVGIAFALYRTRRGFEHAILPITTVVFASFFFYSERKEGFYLLPFAPLFALYVAYCADGVRRSLAWVGKRIAPARWRAGTIAIVLAAILVAAPAMASASKSIDRYVKGQNQESYFGSGTREAAQWIREHDPDAGQYGTLLGRFTLHWYDEQPTFHWYVSHDYIDQRIAEGKLKYVVYDEYLQLAFDQAYMRSLVDNHGGKAVATFQQGWGKVVVFELSAGTS